MLGRNVGVAQGGRLLAGVADDAGERAGGPRLLHGGALGRRQRRERGVRAGFDLPAVDADGVEKRHGHPALLGEERGEQVEGLDLRVARVGRKPNGLGERLLRFGRQFVHKPFTFLCILEGRH